MRWLRGQTIRGRITLWAVLIAIILVSAAGFAFRAGVETIVASSTHTLLTTNGGQYEDSIQQGTTENFPKPGEDQLLAVVNPHGTVMVSSLPDSLEDRVAQLIRLGGNDTRKAAAVDLNAVITEMSPKLTRSLGIGRSLNLQLQPEIPAIEVDPEELRETLLRLIVNARNATPDGGLAEISTTESEDSDGRKSVRLTIWDNGKSVRANARERIFDPYFESRPGIGSPGFSLALAYHFATLSGGTMEVESGSNDGTAYVMNFPAVDRPSEHVPIPAGVTESQTLGASA